MEESVESWKYHMNLSMKENMLKEKKNCVCEVERFELLTTKVCIAQTDTI